MLLRVRGRRKQLKNWGKRHVFMDTLTSIKGQLCKMKRAFYIQIVKSGSKGALLPLWFSHYGKQNSGIIRIHNAKEHAFNRITFKFTVIFSTLTCNAKMHPMEFSINVKLFEQLKNLKNVACHKITAAKIVCPVIVISLLTCRCENWN